MLLWLLKNVDCIAFEVMTVCAKVCRQPADAAFTVSYYEHPCRGTPGLCRETLAFSTTSPRTRHCCGPVSTLCCELMWARFLSLRNLPLSLLAGRYPSPSPSEWAIAVGDHNCAFAEKCLTARADRSSQKRGDSILQHSAS